MFAAAVSTLALAAIASAAPLVEKRAAIDITILQYALTLEHLENKFYSDALAKYDAKAFTDAGFPDWVRRRVVQIGQHEQSHVAFLQGALGAAATQPCVYNFPYNSVSSFLGLSSAIENVGVTAYLGAASSITIPAYVTAAGAILTTEARHQAWMNSAVLKGSAWSGAYDTPLGFSQVYTIAANFIVSCPATNPALPVVAFAPVTVSPAAPAAGSKVKLTFKTTGTPESLFVYSGLNTFMLPIAADATTTLPAGIQGKAYGVVSTAPNATAITDGNTVAGVLLLDFGLSSFVASTN